MLFFYLDRLLDLDGQVKWVWAKPISARMAVNVPYEISIYDENNEILPTDLSIEP